MLFVVDYQLAADGLSKVRDAFPGHKRLLDEFHARGLALMAGPIGNPPTGALGVFATREAAEDFVRQDPFVTGGAVGTWSIREWNEALSHKGAAG